jgi:Cys-tRNA synthase (O-phospho-L-seryl-tRNA:Cys-tRNA synthase)
VAQPTPPNYSRELAEKITDKLKPLFDDLIDYLITEEGTEEVAENIAKMSSVEIVLILLHRLEMKYGVVTDDDNPIERLRNKRGCKGMIVPGPLAYQIEEAFCDGKWRAEEVMAKQLGCSLEDLRAACALMGNRNR